jgi:hypothetical protein
MKYSLKKQLLSESFYKQIQDHPDWKEGTSLFKDPEAALNRAAAAREIWQQHADMNFVNSLVYVHFGPNDVGLIKAADTSNELSCTVIDGSGDIPPYWDYGEVGVVIQGEVTLLFNDGDEAYTGFEGDFGKNRGMFMGNASNIVVDKANWNPDGALPEALVKNFRVVAITCDPEDVNLQTLKKLYEKQGINLPVIAIDDPTLMKFANGASRRNLTSEK